MKTLSEMIVALHVERYFPYAVLAQILGVDTAVLENSIYHDGNWNLLFQEEKYIQIMSTVTFLYYLDDNADMRVLRFLQVLYEFHHISPETIASYAGITKADLLTFENDPANTNGELKFKIAAVVMSLRYMCKDSEEKQVK